MAVEEGMVDEIHSFYSRDYVHELILTLLIMVSRAKATLVMRAAKLMGQRPSLRRRPSDSEAELCDERSEGRKPSKN